MHTKFTQTCNSDVISAADALFLSVFHFVFMSEKTLSGNALLPCIDSMYATSLNIFLGTCGHMPWKQVCHFSPALACDCTVHFNATFAEENSLYIVSLSVSASNPSAEHASERLLKSVTDFKDNVCSTDVIASEEKLNDCSKYESAFCRPMQKSASIYWLICSVKMSGLKIYFCRFDFTLKSGTFDVPWMVSPGRGTAWHKSGTSREIRFGWQPYAGR